MQQTEDKEFSDAIEELCRASGTVVLDIPARGDELAAAYAESVTDRSYEIEDAALERDELAGAPNAINQILKPWIAMLAELVGSPFRRFR